MNNEDIYSDDLYLVEETDANTLAHIGKGHLDGGHSGRYPWGSGKAPYCHDQTFTGYVTDLRRKGLSNTDIARGMGITSNELRLIIKLDEEDTRMANTSRAEKLMESGKSWTEIGKIMGVNESTVRGWIQNEEARKRAYESSKVAEVLKAEIAQHGPTDVGAGAAERLGVTEDVLNAAIARLQEEGYNTHSLKLKQVGSGNATTVIALTSGDTDWASAGKTLREGSLHIINDPYNAADDATWGDIEFPRSISSKRVYVNYTDESGEHGGIERDGLIEIRPGLEDLNIGNRNYAQVRIAVDGDKYMKGMCVYNKNIPEGYDVIYHSKKTSGDPFKKMKEIEDPDNPGHKIIDKENPFGSTIKSNEYDDEGNVIREIGQRHYIDSNGKRQLNMVNIINEEGDWQQWTSRLASQFLSKQSVELAQQQLNLSYDKQKREFDEIMSLNNPEIKKNLLSSFADDCDSKAAHMKAAPLPGQQSHAIIPVTSLADGKIYAPNYPEGSIVSLIRYPHAGKFEIVTGVVDHKNKEAINILGSSPKDAIGINSSAAAKLSGADFDGDTVLVIPNPGGRMIASRPALEALKNFNTEREYPHVEGAPTVGLRTKAEREPGYTGEKHDGFKKGLQMGMISNLITDMQLHNATDDEIARAVKHSMVVIDAEKHNLNWKKSEIDNDIKSLRDKYQPHANGVGSGGASTLISRATGEVRVPKRKAFTWSQVDPETGEINWKEQTKYTYDKDTHKFIDTGEPIRKKKRLGNGQYVETGEVATQKVTRMSTVKDAGELSSGTPMEDVYANYANRMKALANEARKSYLQTPSTKYSPAARKVYEKEYESLVQKLKLSRANKPLERKANMLANARATDARKNAVEELDYADLKKISGQALSRARKRLGIYKYRVKIEPKEWEAITAGAISSNMISDILSRADTDEVRAYATPRNYTPKMSNNEARRAQQMLNNGYTTAAVADYFGVSTSTIQREIQN